MYGKTGFKGVNYNLKILLVSFSFLLLMVNCVFALDITLNFPEDGSTNSSNDIYFGFTSTPPVFQNATLWANFSGTFQASNSTTNDEMNTLLVSDLADGTYEWYLNISEDLLDWSVSGRRTFTVDTTPPEITIHSPSEKESVFGSFILNATINDAVDVNYVNLTFSRNNTINYSKIATEGDEGWNEFTINPDNSSRFNDTINSVLFADDWYNIYINASDSVGNWNFESRNITINNTVFNVTVLNVIRGTTLNPSIDPNQNLTITVSVKYGNGNPAIALNYTNFTIYDNGTEIFNSSIFDYSLNEEGIYSFNITSKNITSGDTEPATHSISVYVENGNYIGNSTSDKYYNLIVPYITLTFNDLISSIDLNSAETDVFNITIRNNGTADARGINISLSGADFSPLSCTSINLISPGESNTTACSGIIITISSTGTKTITAKANYYNSTDYTATAPHQISVTDSTPSGDDGDGDGGTFSSDSGSSTYNYELSIDSYPVSVEIEPGKSKRVSVKIKNTGNKTLNDIKVKLSGVDWFDWYEVDPSSGDDLFDDDKQTFDIDITVPNGTAIDSYKITIRASADNADDKTKTFDLKVTPSEKDISEINDSVILLETNITQVKRDLDNLLKGTNNTNLTTASDKLKQAENLLSEMKEAINKEEYFKAFQKQNEIKSLLSEIEEIIKAEQERMPQGIFSKISAEAISIVPGGGIGILVIFLGVIGIVAFYSGIIPRGIMPGGIGGYSTETGFKHTTKEKEESLTEKIKKLKDKLLKKLRRESEVQKDLAYNFQRNDKWS